MNLKPSYSLEDMKKVMATVEVLLCKGPHKSTHGSIRLSWYPGEQKFALVHRDRDGAAKSIQTGPLETMLNVFNENVGSVA